MSKASTKRTTRKATGDPLDAMIANIAQLDALFNRLEDMAISGGPSANDCRAKSRIVEDQLLGVEDAAKFVQAHTPMGALLHLYLLHNAIDYFEGEAETEKDKEWVREANRLWFSAVAVLRKQVGSADPTGTRFYNPAGSPWLVLDGVGRGAA